MKSQEFITEGYKEVAQKYIASGSDPTQVKDIINQFKDIVNKNQAKGDERNIDWWGKNKSFDEFNKFVKSIDIKRTKTQVKRQKIAGNSINIFENDNWLVVIPLDKDASCFHGKNTDWCTAKPNQEHFTEYFSQRITLIYCINKQTGNKWAIAVSPYFSPKELFDQNDNSISKEQFISQTNLNPDQLAELASKHKKAIDVSRKEVVKNDPETAYVYAINVLGKRFPEGEKAIASHPGYAYNYARFVLGDRFSQGEKAIASSAKDAYEYALHVIKGRWPEGEKVIASSPRHGLLYARYVINDRDPNTWAKRYQEGKIK